MHQGVHETVQIADESSDEREWLGPKGSRSQGNLQETTALFSLLGLSGRRRASCFEGVIELLVNSKVLWVSAFKRHCSMLSTD